MPSYPLKKCHKILKREEYLKIGAEGKKARSDHFIVLYREKGSGTCRAGITASKKVGNAVCRNRIKRLLREFFRLNREDFNPADIVFIAGKKSGSLDYSELRDELLKVFQRRGLVRSSRESSSK